MVYYKRCDNEMVPLLQVNVLRTSRKSGGRAMNDIIKAIEEEQLKQEVPEFSVGDTVRVYGKIKEGKP